MARRRILLGATGSFVFENTSDAIFPWRYGYYTDSAPLDERAITLFPDAQWGEAQKERLKASFEEDAAVADREASESSDDPTN